MPSAPSSPFLSPRFPFPSLPSCAAASPVPAPTNRLHPGTSSHDVLSAGISHESGHGRTFTQNVSAAHAPRLPPPPPPRPLPQTPSPRPSPLAHMKPATRPSACSSLAFLSRCCRRAWMPRLRRKPPYVHAWQEGSWKTALKHTARPPQYLMRKIKWVDWQWNLQTIWGCGSTKCLVLRPARSTSTHAKGGPECLQRPATPSPTPSLSLHPPA
jgi:hypothetical protein